MIPFGAGIVRNDVLNDVLQTVAAHFGVSVADIRSQRRTRAVHGARVWGVYLASQTTSATFETIGQWFGGRDQTVVRMYARCCARAVAEHRDSARLYDALRVCLTRH